jgi:uncharacterized membrane protein
MRDSIWIALAILGWGSWALFEKLAVRNMSPVMIQLASAYIYSAFAPIMYLAMKAKGVNFEWTSAGIGWTVAASCAATLANYAFLFAIEDRPVSGVMAWTQTYPAISFVLCWLVLGESFSLTKIVGIVMLVCGGVLMSW